MTMQNEVVIHVLNEKLIYVLSKTSSIIFSNKFRHCLSYH